MTTADAIALAGTVIPASAIIIIGILRFGKKNNSSGVSKDVCDAKHDAITENFAEVKSATTDMQNKQMNMHGDIRAIMQKLDIKVR